MRKLQLCQRVAFVLLAIISLCTMYTLTGCESNPETEAWVCAQDVVRDKLRSPSSADFCSYSDATITNLEGDKYKIEGYVDAENGFGATIREDFSVILTLTTNGYTDASCSLG